jgi:uncharacterized cupin superfamily protein
VSFEDSVDSGDRFPDFGINIAMLQPGEPSAMYHSESVQESFLVLGGTPQAILDDHVRDLRPWDFVHCPAGTNHVFVGAGEGPSWVLMVGARSPDATIQYPGQAYSAWSREFTATTMPWPPTT